MQFIQILSKFLKIKKRTFMYIGNINSNFVKAMGSWPTLQISRSISGGEAVCSMTINNSGIILVLESIKRY